MDKGKKFLDQFIKEHNEGSGYSDELNQLFSDYITENFSGILVEDHEKHMTAQEMSKHIKKLFKMCEDEETEEDNYRKQAEKQYDLENPEELQQNNGWGKFFGFY